MHKSHKEQKIHNIAIVGQDGVGKTSLVESLLKFQPNYTKKQIVQQSEETSRGYTIYTYFYHMDLGDESFNLVDTPGNSNFLSNIKSALYPCTAAIFVVSAAGESQGALRIWESIFERKVPRVIFVNGLDLPEANFDAALQFLEANFSIKPTILFMPWFKDKKLIGVIDIINRKLIKKEADKTTVEDLPEESKEDTERVRSITYERLAELDDELMEYYIEEKDAPDELLIKVLSQGIKACEVSPIIAGSVENEIGVETLFGFLRESFPPFGEGNAKVGRVAKPEDTDAVERKPDLNEPFAGFVFKTTYDRYIGKLSYMLVTSGNFVKGLKLINSSAGRKIQVGKFFIISADKTEEIEEAYPGDIVVLEKVEDLATNQTICAADNPVFFDPIPFWPPSYINKLELTNSSKDSRIMDAINKTIVEDPSLKMEYNTETNEMLLSGMGVLHKDVIKEHLKNVYDVEINLSTPQIGYLETFMGSATAQGKYKKQTGGHGQYGDVHITIEPKPRNAGFEFVDKIVGGAIPRNYIPGVEKGVKEALVNGNLAGFPVVDVKVTLFDGSFHNVDSSDFAFQRAGIMAIRKASLEARPVLLEPVMAMEIDVLETDVGKITKDLSGRRGKVANYSYKEFTTVIHAEVPLAELTDYTQSLRGSTLGQGLFTMKLKSYEILAPNLAEKVIASRKTVE